MGILIGVDLGTTNIKLIACSTDGNIVFRNAAECEMIQSSPERAEQDPESILSQLSQLMADAFRALQKEDIMAVSFSAAMHSIIAIDETGSCLTNAILWADTRSTVQEEMLKQNGTAAELYRQTGVPVHPTLPLCKLMWLQQHEPGIFTHAHKFVSLKEFILYRFFGVYVVDHSIAAASGLMDIHHFDWSALALETVGISASRLSTIVPVTHVLTELREDYRKTWGLDRLIPFVVGSSDGCLANIGTGVLNDHTAALTIGTSGAVRVTSASAHIGDRPSLFCYPLTKNLFVTGGAVNNGGYVLEWFAENILKTDLSRPGAYENLVQAAHSVSPGAADLIFLPYLRGDRAPIWDAKARAVFFGLNSTHQQPHMLRAVMEGIIYALYDVFEEMGGVKEKVEALYVSGGFVKSELWVQMVADIFNKKVMATDVADASAMGAVTVALYAIGKTKSITSPIQNQQKDRVYLPDLSHHIHYKKNFQLYRSLYNALKNEFPKLGDG